jgi:hypothetical protein
VELTYEFVSVNPYDTFGEATLWTGNMGSWRVVLNDGKLSATSAEQFASESAARGALEPLLRAWATVAYLRDQHEVTFEPVGAQRSPTPPAVRDRIFRRANSEFPRPDPEFALTSTTERLVELIRGFTSGTAELPATLGELAETLERSAQQAGESMGTAYNIEDGVLETVKELVERDGIYRGPEWQWMQEALRVLTLQAGRRTSTPPSARLRMTDFRTQLAVT